MKDNAKQYILNWLKRHCYGFRNAKNRYEILPEIQSIFPMEDRTFRKIVSELKHDGHVGATNGRGYWFIPLVMVGPNAPEEIRAALESVDELESKALDMLRDTSTLRTRFVSMKNVPADLFIL